MNLVFSEELARLYTVVAAAEAQVRCSTTLTLRTSLAPFVPFDLLEQMEETLGKGRLGGDNGGPNSFF